MADVNAELACDVLAADGATLHIRPIRPDDGTGLIAFHGRLSKDTVYRRFFSPHPRLSPTEVERFTHVDYHDRLALVAEEDGQLVAVARFDSIPDTADAEVAFVVDDAYQGRGLGTLLLEHLASAARTRGIHRFVAETLATNRAMLGVFARAGYQVRRSFDHGVVHLEFPLEPTDQFLRAVEARDHLAESRSIESLLCPGAVAVVGASPRPGGVGHAIFANLVSGGYTGAAYPVNRGGEPVAGHPGYARLADVPGPVDLVVVAVPPADAVGLVAEAAQVHARGLLVISAGFAEAGPGGADLQRQLVDAGHRMGMRIVGPNCLGIANTAPGVSLNATFSPVAPVAGPTGLLSQSGAVGIVALDQASRIGLGISTFVSVGNKADVSGNDLLEYWEDDPATQVICLYLESFGNPRRFARLARRVARHKPIVAVKSGRTDAGRRAASSHTAAAASSDAAVDALLTGAGVIRVDTLTELFDTALVLAEQPLPAGDRVAVVGNSGGPGILAADACGLVGLTMPELSPATQAELRSFLPPSAAVTNPVDLLASATPEAYRRALAVVLDDPGVDAAIVVYTAPLISDPEEIGAAVASAADGASKPIVASFLGTERPPAALRLGGVPCLPFPERAAQALARAHAYRVWRDTPEGSEPTLDGIDRAAAQEIVARALARPVGGGWLDAPDAWAILRAYGFPIADSCWASSAEEAVDAAEATGYPVALKAASGRIVHKSDVGGVLIGLADAGAVRAGFDAITSALGDRAGGVIVQRMADAGVETIVGVVNDETFGPLIMFGLGGVATDLLGDRVFRAPPLTDTDAAAMVRSPRSSPLLTGYRGSVPVDVDALEEVVLRVARLAEEVPELAELDLNPVVARPSGVLVLDVKLRVAQRARRPDPWLRRLR